MGTSSSRSSAALWGERLAIAAVVVLLAATTITGGAGTDEARPVDLLALALLAIGVAVLAGLGRRAPAVVALASLVLTIAWYSIGYENSSINLLTLAAFFNLGLRAGWRQHLTVGVLTVVTVAVAMLVVGDEAAAEATAAIGWVLAVLLLGALVRNRRLLLAEYRERAELAEAERDAEAERRVQRARMDIARDLHDLLAHTVSVMTVQAGVASDSLDRDPEAARRALHEIRAAGREAMGEVRTLVHVLRDGDDPSWSPSPGLDRLPELVASFGGAEPRMELTMDVDGALVPEPVALTVHRIVQESLTNVVRHAGAHEVTVTVAVETGRLVVEVIDDGVGARTAPGTTRTTGFGLIGMRERVESLGGTLSAGPGPSGGWVVRAVLPLAEQVLRA